LKISLKNFFEYFLIILKCVKVLNRNMFHLLSQKKFLLQKHSKAGALLSKVLSFRCVTHYFAGATLRDSVPNPITLT